MQVIHTLMLSFLSKETPPHTYLCSLELLPSLADQVVGAVVITPARFACESRSESISVR